MPTVARKQIATFGMNGGEQDRTILGSELNIFRQRRRGLAPRRRSRSAAVAGTVSCGYRLYRDCAPPHRSRRPNSPARHRPGSTASAPERHRLAMRRKRGCWRRETRGRFSAAVWRDVRDGVRVEAQRLHALARHLVFRIRCRVVQEELCLPQDGIAFTIGNLRGGARRPSRRGGARLTTGPWSAERHRSS